MEKLDCLFLHVPKWKNEYRPMGEFIWINYLPMGLFGLADLLHRNRISTQIVHTGVEWVENHDFSLLDYVKKKAPRMVALDLHWHHQSFDVMEAAKSLKAAFPNLYLLLGGFTASFFHEEILRNFDGIDGVIRGEAETPMVELAKAILQGKEDFFSIPNLTWRRKGRILVNPLSYVASEEDLSLLSFTNFPLLKNYPAYIRYVGQPFYVKGLSKKGNFRLYSLKSPIYHLTVGRGCPVQCTWCGGGLLSQKTITGREEVIFRRVGEVLRSIEEAIAYGYETFHICFDPYPQDPQYFLDLFSHIRREKLKVECIFESYGLPTVDFIRSFKETFPGPKSLIALSPDVGSARIRKVHKGFAYDDLTLMECLDGLERHRVFCDLFFTLGVPFETEEDFNKTIELQRKIRRRYSNVRGIRTFTIEIEPGSPWHLDPDTFGVKTSLRDFMDFYHYHSRNKGPFSSLGYWIPDSFESVEDEKGFEKALQKERCRHFCFLHPDARKTPPPFWGRRFCDLSRLFWKIKGLRKK